MEKLVIHGPVKLEGTVRVSGAKNSVLPILAASILTAEKSVIRNAPALADVATMLDILAYLGLKYRYLAHDVIEVDTSGIQTNIAPYEYVRRMRASVCLLGALVGRLGSARVSLPGGCVIGPRPIDLHIKGLNQLGADTTIEHGYVMAELVKKKDRRDIFLGGRFGSSVLATANILMASVMLPGITCIESAACEPEVVDLVDFLCAMGAHIKGRGSHALTIEGVDRLHGTDFTVIPDRIESATFMIAAAAAGGRIRLTGVESAHLSAVTEKLKETGVSIEKQSNTMTVESFGRPSPVDITTLPYPGFPTDVQAQMTAYLSLSRGVSIITEKVYPERFMHISELNRLGADISLEGSSAIIKGTGRLSGAPVMASDLRASAALVIAGLVAQGTTEVNRIYHLDRGYGRIDEKLRSLGAQIERREQDGV